MPGSIHVSQNRRRHHQLSQLAAPRLGETGADLKQSTPYHGELRLFSEHLQQCASVGGCRVALWERFEIAVQCVKHPDWTVMREGGGPVPDVTVVCSDCSAPSHEVERLAAITRSCSTSPLNVVA